MTTDKIKFKSLTFRPLTAATLATLQRMGADLSAGRETIQAVLEYAYVTTQPLKKVIKSTPESWPLDVLQWAEAYSKTDLERFAEIMTEDLTKIDESKVETKDTGGGKN